jgi:tetrapyrrole methylase family protein / MazG family protein
MPEPGAQAAIDELLGIVARLHAPEPEGCPWCLAQTRQTLSYELVKEAYEAEDAARHQDARMLQEELGDVFLLVATLAHQGSMARDFTLDDVVRGVAEKVVRRHPHIFGETKASTPAEVLRNWDAIKQQEDGAPASSLASIPRSLPALMRADEMQQRAARTGFDWPDSSGVLDKLHEEVAELAAATAGPEEAEELGDLLFVLVKLSRRLGFSAEGALGQACDKFARRFASIEEACRNLGVRPQDLPLDQLEELWALAKADEKG